jgi:hypothetical protein
MIFIFLSVCLVVLLATRLYRRSLIHVYILDLLELALVFAAFFLLAAVESKLVISATLIFIATRLPRFYPDSPFYLAQNSISIAQYVFLFVACVAHLDAQVPALLFDAACAYRIYATCTKAV